MGWTRKDGSRDFKVVLPNIEKFYTECDILEPHGSEERWEEITKGEDYEAHWVGIPFKSIEKHKFSYKEGLDKLKKLEAELALGGSKKQYRWNEFDGDDISMERMYEGMPYMAKRIKQLGDGNGKFVTIHVSVCENANVGADELLHKAYTAMQLIDLIEGLGYRVAVEAYMDSRDPGVYKGITMSTLHTAVTIKRFEDPLNKPLLLTCISPWFLRYHMFRFWYAKFKMSHGLGSAYDPGYKDTKEDIYIKQGECLNDGTETPRQRRTWWWSPPSGINSIDKIKELEKEFGFVVKK